MDGTTFQQLQQQDWGQISQELLLHTIFRTQRYPWQSGGAEELAKGAQPKDIVQHVIEKTLNGDRKWDPNKGPLVPWLKDQVNSVVDALYHSAANKHEARLVSNDDNGNVQGRSQKLTSHLFHTSILATPEEEILIKEDEELSRQQVDRILELVADKSELQDILFAIIEGCQPKPKLLAERLEVDVKEINNRLKRLRRMVRKEGNYEQS